MTINFITGLFINVDVTNFTSIIELSGYLFFIIIYSKMDEKPVLKTRRKQPKVIPTPPPMSILISAKQLTRVKAGQNIRIQPKAIQHPDGVYFMCLHPDNYSKLSKAKMNGKSTKIAFSNAELAGSGLKDVLSGLLDVATPLASAFMPQYAPAIMAGRQVAKNLGVGITDRTVRAKQRKGRKGRMVKGSAEAKAYMAHLRAMRNHKRGTRATAPEGEGFKDFLRKTGQVAKKAGKYAEQGYKFAKEKGLLTKGADYLEQQAMTRFPQYKDEAQFVRGQVRKRLGFGINQAPLFQYGSGIVPAGYHGM